MCLYIRGEVHLEYYAGGSWNEHSTFLYGADQLQHLATNYNELVA